MITVINIRFCGGQFFLAKYEDVVARVAWPV